MRTFRLGSFAVVFWFYPKPGIGWGISKWQYFSQSSWKHGTLYLGRVKIMW